MTGRWRASASAVLVAIVASAGAAPRAADDREISLSLATLLKAARSVISDEQALIDDPALGDKKLTGQVVLDLARPIYRKALRRDPLDTDPKSREGELLRAEMAAITAVMDENQPTLNAKGVGFKGFIPAVFGRLVTEAFAARANGKASIKITAPVDLVRNRKSLPDAWERSAIEDKFLSPGWPKGQDFSETVATPSGPAFRVAMPEYYAESCLSCHGQPKGAPDITGCPKEGAELGDLGGVISIALRK